MDDVLQQINIVAGQSITSAQTKEILRILNNLPDLPKSVGPVDFYFTPYSVGLHKLTHVNDIKLYMDKFQYLSEPAQKLMFDFSTAEFIEEKLGPAFDMDAYQKVEVTEVVRDIVLGDIFIGDMVKETQRKLEVDENRAKDVASMIVAQLFPPAIESIKRTQRFKFPLKIKELAQGQQGKPTQPIQQPLTQPTARPLVPPSVRPEALPKIEVRPQSAPLQPLPNLNMSDIKPQNPNPQPLSRPQFKIPDIGQPVTKENGGAQSQDAQKSLEQELEKVANVIDLRNKPNE